MYAIKYDKSVLKFLAKHQDIQARFLEKILVMRVDPLDPSLDVKPLLGSDKGSYRLRIGGYRFKFIIINSDLFLGSRIKGRCL